jgi:hypothetical protein
LGGLVHNATFFGRGRRGNWLLTITGAAREGQKGDCGQAGDNKLFHAIIFL